MSDIEQLNEEKKTLSGEMGGVPVFTIALYGLFTAWTPEITSKGFLHDFPAFRVRLRNP